MSNSISTLSYYQEAIVNNQQLASQLDTLQAEAATGQQYAQVSDTPKLHWKSWQIPISSSSLAPI